MHLARIEYGVQWMGEDMRDLVRIRLQGVKQADIGQQRNDRCHDEVMGGHEGIEKADRMDVRAGQRKLDLLVGFPELMKMRFRLPFELFHLTAVSTTFASVGSTRPPGRAVCPLWVLRDLERVVRRTCSCSSRSNSRTRTPANFDVGWADLYRYDHAIQLRDG